MNQLPPLGKAIAQIVRPTFQIYAPLLQQRATAIKSTPYKTFSYGSDPRQNLDVYYPASNPSGSGCPVLVFLYGGGLVNGAKILPVVPNGLVYANAGHFFAEKCGFVTIVADYRLVPQARFPSGGEDLALVVEWARLNLKVLGSEDEQKDLFLMGNSAGGVHLSTYLFHSTFAEYRQRVLGNGGSGTLRLRGAILLSVPVHFQNAAPDRSEVLTTYYGDRLNEDCPLGLLKTLKQSSSVSESLPGVRFLSLLGELDPEDEILSPNEDFSHIWKAGKTGETSTLQVENVKGHNHISPLFALALDDPKEEAWGYQVAEFCTSARG